MDALTVELNHNQTRGTSIARIETPIFFVELVYQVEEDFWDIDTEGNDIRVLDIEVEEFLTLNHTQRDVYGEENIQVYLTQETTAPSFLELQEEVKGYIKAKEIEQRNEFDASC